MAWTAEQMAQKRAKLQKKTNAAAGGAEPLSQRKSADSPPDSGALGSSRVPIKQYLQKFPQWGRFGVTSVTPFLLLPVHPEGCTPAHRT